jgi:hypothetical protein
MAVGQKKNAHSFSPSAAAFSLTDGTFPHDDRAAPALPSGGCLG